MASTRAAHKASAKARKARKDSNTSATAFGRLADEGELARAKGTIINPYPIGSDEAEAWAFGNEVWGA
jgi:hypothetical protein